MKKGDLQFDKTFRIRFLFVLLPVIAVGAIGLAIFSFSDRVLDEPILDKQSVVNDIEKEEAPAPQMGILIPAENFFATEFSGTRRINILLLGDTDENLTDTIMLLSIDPDTQSIAIVSVPRDTYYHRDGYSDGSSSLKINSVYKEGITATAQAVHDTLLGIPINYYCIVAYDGVAKIVDAIGGVPINVPKPMLFSSPGQNLFIDIPAGEQILDGEQAIQYLRYRSGYYNGDIGRIEAQQKFVHAAINQIRGYKYLTVAKACYENIDSDLTLRTILSLADIAKGLDMSDVSTAVLPGYGEMISGLSFYMPASPDEIEIMLREIYTTTVPGP